MATTVVLLLPTPGSDIMNYDKNKKKKQNSTKLENTISGKSQLLGFIQHIFVVVINYLSYVIK